MNIEILSKITLICIYSLFSLIRIEYYRRAKKAGYRTVIEERKKYSAWLSIFICYEVFTFFIYILSPELLYWAAMPLYSWLRIFGVLMGVAALIWFIWIHQSLGNNLSVRLSIKDKQVLVTEGPYRLIRHPMYSTFYLLHLAVFFLTANWFIGLSWLAGLTFVILIRVKREEDMLIKRFGDDYYAYIKRTGRFLPPIKFGAKKSAAG